MKKNLFTLIFAIILITAKSQVIIDTVSTAAGYANQVWYSLANDNQATSAKTNWDIAFDASGFGTSILINSATGTTLWNYPGADTTAWNTVDTTGINTWMKRWNADTSWAMGAMGRYASISNPNDLDWGIYNQITHVVTGDSLYIIKLASGSYKKLWIKSLSSGVYTFKYADLNGANTQNQTLAKATYTNQNFGYFSLQNNAALSREPVSANWDLVFTQYTTFLPTPYTVTGILHNRGVRVAKLKPIANANTFTNWGPQLYKTAINTIGYDWKVFTGTYVIEDSLVYFVRAKNGDMWKVIPTGFGGSADGKYMFSKEKLSTVGIKEETENSSVVLSVYPNPSNTGNATIIYDFANEVQDAVLNIYDVSGKSIYSEKLNNNMGLHTYNLNTSAINAGLYFVSLNVNGQRIQQKLIIK